ncbi:hypothetical protein [Streptomyces sp. NPDC058964]|uniref:hypothetical protein n=1 Tax=Streptomyces sp. NPDC058964 TaxID=3346681 RepID=UPI0036CF7B6C
MPLARRHFLQTGGLAVGAGLPAPPATAADGLAPDVFVAQFEDSGTDDHLRHLV